MTSGPLSTRLLTGAIAGVVATAAMTAAVRRLHARLPPGERYPLPPREINEVLFDGSETGLRDATLATHFGFGAAAAALLTAARPRFGMAEGAAVGLLVWLSSYFGWVPAAGILRPASAHPARRNLLMIGAHLLWGAVAAVTVSELRAARSGPFAGGPLRDRS